MNINVLYYETGSGFGGSAVSLYRLVKYIRQKAVQPVVLVHGIGPKIEQLQKMGVTVRLLRSYQPIPQVLDKARGRVAKGLKDLGFCGNVFASAFLNALKLSTIIKRSRIDLVHLNNGIFENVAGLIAAKICRIPCISHVRGTEPITRMEYLFGRYVDRIVTLNGKMYKTYRSAFGNKKSCFIFNGVDLDGLDEVDRDRARRKFGIKDHCFLVGTFARLVPGKGIPEFIKAAAKVLEKRKETLFFVVGDDPLLSRSFEYEMKQLAVDLGVSEQVMFTGWRNDVADLMGGMDLIVQVSTYPEGMSLTPLEAMALGKPIITSIVPGYMDSIEQGINGILVAPGDYEGLANEILKMAFDKDLAGRLGANGREKVLREFDMRIVATRIRQLYDDVLGMG